LPLQHPTATFGMLIALYSKGEQNVTPPPGIAGHKASVDMTWELSYTKKE